MKPSFRCGVDFTLIALAALGLAVLFPLGVESDGPVAPPGEGANAEIRECGKEEGAKLTGEKKLELTAKKGQSLQFKCAASQTLAPAEGASGDNFPKAYKISKSGDCDTQAAVNLTELITDGKLTKSERQVENQGSEPVYTFLYTSAQDTQKDLCYMCNPSSVGDNGGPGRFKTLVSGPGAQTACTVLITVPRDEQTQATTGAPPAPTAEAPSASTTKAPTTSTSDASAVRPAVVAATGSFLAVMLLA
ncbi:hypothetical protein CSUI_008233 [Cystoisospora suis]|uniref:SRS domain-containing protein n=1 Tax=Cystoisospora suis TaxID=483139 RepID=A0A2C6KNH8_9APIC|nr:hypothetical protein CSUI_008233 [Cystoisospora suis]